MIAAASDITTVRIIILIPSEMKPKNGIFINAALAAKLIKTRAATILLRFASGMNTEMNIP